MQQQPANPKRIPLFLLLLSIVAAILGYQWVRGGDSEPALTSSIDWTPMPDSFNQVRFIELTPDKSLEILRTGVILPHTTNNCGSPMISTETLEKSRQYTLEVELSASDTVIVEISRSFGVEVNSAETLAAVKGELAKRIGQELQKSYHIKVGESIGVISSRTIQTPPDYYSSIDLQWEEAHSVGIAQLRSLNSNEVYEVPFQYVSDMHLVQVAVVYTPCSQNTEEQAPSFAQELPGLMPNAGNIELLSPLNVECRNDVLFQWNAQPGVQYQATAVSLGHDYQTTSNWIEGSTWQQNLPREYWGSWEWFVVAKDGSQSKRATFIFNPQPKGDRTAPCTNEVANALQNVPSVVIATATADPNGISTISAPIAGEQIDPVSATQTPVYAPSPTEETLIAPLPSSIPTPVIETLVPYPSQPQPTSTESPLATTEVIPSPEPSLIPTLGYPSISTQSPVYP